MDEINPAFWLDVVRTNAHTTDCREKSQALTNAADKLAAYVAATRQQLATVEAQRKELRAGQKRNKRERDAAVARMHEAEAERERAVKDAERYRWLRTDAYECVVRHGNTVRGSRTGWITHIHPGPDFDAAIDAAIAAAAGDAEVSNAE